MAELGFYLRLDNIIGYSKEPGFERQIRILRTNFLDRLFKTNGGAGITNGSSQGGLWFDFDSMDVSGAFFSAAEHVIKSGTISYVMMRKDKPITAYKAQLTNVTFTTPRVTDIEGHKYAFRTYLTYDSERVEVWQAPGGPGPG